MLGREPGVLRLLEQRQAAVGRLAAAAREADDALRAGGVERLAGGVNVSTVGSARPSCAQTARTESISAGGPHDERCGAGVVGDHRGAGARGRSAR